MTDVLDELREQMRALVPTLGHMLPESGLGKHVTLGALDVFDVLDAFEAAHPGLVDVDFFPPSKHGGDYAEDCLDGVFAFLAQFTTDGGENVYCEDLYSAIRLLKERACAEAEHD